MNNMRNYYMFLFSLYQYCYVIELEQTSYVMYLAYETLCLIVHTTQVRTRTKLRWQFVIPSDLPFPYACRSVGSESRGIRVVSLYTSVVLKYTGTFGCDSAPRLRGRQQVVTALSVPCNPPCSGIHIGALNCLMRFLADQYSQVSPSICMLRARS